MCVCKQTEVVLLNSVSQRQYPPAWGNLRRAGLNYWTPWRPGKTENKPHRASF